MRALGNLRHALRFGDVPQRRQQRPASAFLVGLFHRRAQVFIGEGGIAAQQFDYRFGMGARCLADDSDGDHYGAAHFGRAGLARLPQIIRGLLRNPQIGATAVLDT